MEAYFLNYIKVFPTPATVLRNSRLLYCLNPLTDACLELNYSSLKYAGNFDEK